jgi:nanoRNase/pAp phosphatase (c-di-AMP/oligoRNAs hydrolase)
MGKIKYTLVITEITANADQDAYTGCLALRELLDQRNARKPVIMYHGELSRRDEIL